MEKGSKGVKIKEIAEKAGVSSGTVSIVLNGRGDELRISKETQERIRELAQEMNYTPNMSARRLRNSAVNGPNYTVAVFWNTDVMQFILGQYLSELIYVVNERDLKIEFVTWPYSSGKLYKLAELFNPNRYSGIIINSATDEDLKFLMDNSFSIPIVVMNRNTGGKYMNVALNDYEGGKKCAEIFSLNGHRRVGIVGMREISLAMRLRKMGFVDGCRENNLEIRDEWIMSATEVNYEEGYRMAEALLTRPERPTAFIVMHDFYSIGVVNACKKLNLRIPDDAEFIVYGFNPLYENYFPGISSFGSSYRDMAEAAIELLFLAFKNPKLTLTKYIFVRFNLGGTCRKPPSGDFC